MRTRVEAILVTHKLFGPFYMHYRFAGGDLVFILHSQKVKMGIQVDHEREVAAGSRFKFGEIWERFLRVLAEDFAQRIAGAVKFGKSEERSLPRSASL